MFRLGKAQEGQSICANVPARQQMTGDDHMDTLETRRRVALANSELGQRHEAIQAMTKYSESIGRLLGQSHIIFFATLLDMAEQVFSQRLADSKQDMLTRYTGSDLQADAVDDLLKELNTRLGKHHPLTICGMWISAAMQSLNPEKGSDASETFRRALTTAEEYLGSENSEIMSIIGITGIMLALRGLLTQFGYNPYIQGQSANLHIALPWLQRYLTCSEKHMESHAPMHKWFSV